MYQANSKKIPPATMRSAIAAVAQTRLEAAAVGVATMGVMPRGLNATDAKAVATMAHAIQAARNANIKN